MRYPAKLLLLGEYTVVNASHALARPFPRFSGAWAWGEAEDPELRAFLSYLRQAEREGSLSCRLDIDAFGTDIEAGLRFASDIRKGYGLGSSGALCAAVYDRYAHDHIKGEDRAHYHLLKKQLAQLESFFHGSSSGADPLVSYLNRPLLLLYGGKAASVFLPEPDPPYHFFLLDTGQERQTGPLVQYFLESCQDPAFASAIESRLAPANNAAIQAWLAGDMSTLFQRWREISVFQFRYLLRMVPEPLRPLWEQSLHQGTYALKLCGAGGGGYLLGMCDDWYLTQKMLADWPLLSISPGSPE